ncbi:hypothetical protein [Sphaerisporangium rhizosphaerae]|uniref:Uncharacterized protein n=1 Tax=Sphaerisporangium rhizosphaerae TaxID=2269375 RepID=A0ABW2NYZ7_9ACTN
MTQETGPVPGTGPLSPDFTGIDPDRMAGFITEIDHARGTIAEHTEAIRRVFAANDLPATSLTPIAEVEHWIDTHLPDLRRRVQTARNTAQLPNWSPQATHLIPYEEKSALPTADAQRLGRELAAQYKKAGEGLVNLDRQADYQKVLDTLAQHVHDPAYTAAFFAALGVHDTLQLPVVLREHLGDPGEATLAPPRPDDELIRTVSQAFATAVSSGSRFPGMTQISNALRSPNLDPRDTFGASLILAAGAFPAEWLAQVVAARGLATPREVQPGYLYALGNNSAAARLAIKTALGDSADQSALKKWLKGMSDRTSGPYATDIEADAFGRMLAAASGAYDEKDGTHSDDAATFAFTLMTTVDDLKLGEATRIHLAEIAGSYATEITEGASLRDDNRTLPTTFGRIASQIPGLNPVFRLSPKDTYRFIKTFTNSTENQMPFREGMGNLAQRLIRSEVANMLKSHNLTRLEDIFAALGDVNGVQLATAEKLAKVADDAEEAASKNFSMASGTILGVAGIFVPYGMTGATLWTLLGAEWSALDTYKNDRPKEADRIRSADELETLGRRHAIAQLLVDSGIRPKVSLHDYRQRHPGTAIADEAGRLCPFTDILNSGDEGLDDFDEWLMENGRNGDRRSLGKLADDLATQFDGHKSFAKARTAKRANN